MAHLDVAPVEGSGSTPRSAGTSWTATSGAAGRLTTRAAWWEICAAVERLTGDRFTPAQDIWLSFDCNEEASGTAALAGEELKKQGVKPWFVIDEGGVIVSEAFPGGAAPIGVIGVTEKGVTSVELGVEGRGGHASTPARMGPRPRTVRAITCLDRSPTVLSDPVPRLEERQQRQGFMVLDDRQMIDQIVMRRQALASLEAGEAAELLDYVDRARAAGERAGGQARGRRRVEAAVHELSLAMTLPVPTIERRVVRARRLRSTMPQVWQAWHDGRISTAHVIGIDRAATRLLHPASVATLDDLAVDRLAALTPGQATRWLDRWVERTESAESARRHQVAYRDRKVALRPLGDGMTRMTADITAGDAAAIMQKLTGTAHQLPADDDRTIDQARADLLVDTLLDRRAGGLGYRAVIGITVPLSSLMGFSDAPGELTDRSATIPAHIVRAAMADQTSLLY
ncbi:MAG: peptidase [Aeromicrobium sp.]|nr:peptidase [Aeromicrobium sp.]